MANRNERVMDVVVRELEKDPEAQLETLYARAKEVDPSIGDLSLRQFHARYPLQAKRRRASGQPKKQASRRKKKAQTGEPQKSPRKARRSASQDGGPDREALRALFLEFATEFAAADTRSQIVRVISSVDGYVERVRKLARS